MFSSSKNMTRHGLCMTRPENRVQEVYKISRVGSSRVGSGGVFNLKDRARSRLTQPDPNREV